jgi:beta-galactosidase
MKKICSILLIVAIPAGLLYSQLHPDWENPEVFEKNQVSPHATLMPYDRLDQALDNKRKESPNHLTLNGTWEFNWSGNPDLAPSGFYLDGFDRSGWDRIRVPSNWQMEGFGYPIFRNIGQPFSNRPPDVPDDFNPVGSYYRTFEVPSAWKGKHIFLHFEGVHSASYVWINGKEVGYNQGGMEPAEYDVTRYLEEGKNSISVKVLRFSDGSFMEDQDTWRLSGIYRDVYLMATPEVHISDFYVTTDLDEAYRDCILKLETDITNFLDRGRDGLAVRVQLYDGDRKPVFGVPGIIKVGHVEGGLTSRVAASFPVSSPAKWSAEYPNLYTLVMELLDGQGDVTEILSTRVGFREVEIRQQAIWINGVRVKFNGVNSHMLHPETGHAMDTGTMKKDLLLMKRFNINCVRTSHYPPNVEYLDLADELGVYIVDETGDEAHAYQYISRMPEWRAQYLDRMRKMVYRDRNHPAVVIWSAGNESGPGDNLCAIMEEGKRIDPGRPGWMYGGNDDRDPKTNPIKCEDIVGPRYLPPFPLEQLFAKSDDPRPSFMDEYIAATGNSLGGLNEYWELIRRYPRLTGGAIWDWISPGINQPVVTTPDGSPGHIQCVLMNRAHLVDGISGKALYLSGHDDWLEAYRDPSLDISGDGITLSFLVRPEPYNGYGHYLTKGDYQFGIIQPDSGHLEFYLHTGERTGVRGKLPPDCPGGWHHVAGVYDGKEMVLYVDGKIIGSRSCRGNIVNGPERVAIGKSTSMDDSHMGPLTHATVDRVRIFPCPLSPAELEGEEEALKARSVLWLDFESTRNEGEFWSIGLPGRTYGLVWPDRTVQPELWQLKKSPQPVAIRAIHPEKGTVEITNLHHFRDLGELDATWELAAEGMVVQQGKLDLDLPPGETKVVHIPFEPPGATPGIRYHLLVRFALAEDLAWAPKGHEVAWEQFELHFVQEQPAGEAIKPFASAPAGEATPQLDVEKDGDRVILAGEGFSYTIGRKSGLIESMVVDGDELFRKGPRFNVWRAPLANDQDPWGTGGTDIGHTGEGMGREIANGWRSIGLDRLVHDMDRFSLEEGEGKAEVFAETSVHANNYTTGFRVRYHYTIFGNGEVTITAGVLPQGRMTHWLPKIGLQLELPGKYGNVEWFGRGPFETYPDRKTGAKIGKYSRTVEEDYVPYIIPQDYGNKTDVRWISLTDDSGRGLHVSGEEPFNASAQMYTTDNLTRAFYTFQLKEEDVVVLNLDHQVSGVGGTAIMLLNQYRVLPGETSFTFHLKPRGL